jgi:hypothetical protein
MLTGSKTSLAFIIMTILGGGSTLTTLQGLHQLGDTSKSQESQEFSLGTHTTRISSPNGCFGSIRIKGERDKEDITFSLDGWLLLSYQNSTYPISMKGDASFNSLKQLSNSILEIRLPKSVVTFGTIGVNPIRLGTAYYSEGKGNAHAIPLPGPLMLEAKSPGSYSIKHGDISDISFTKFTPLLKSFYSSSVAFVPDNKNECEKDKSIPYGVDSIVDSLLAIGRLLPQYKGEGL